MNDTSKPEFAEEKKRFLIKRIKEKVFIQNFRETFSDTENKATPWILDFRNVLLDAVFLEAITDSMLSILRKQVTTKVQFGGLESAALPLITSLVLKYSGGNFTVHGFYIRKSRKKSGLLKIIEGEVGEEEIVLVDDILNSGSSVLKQILILESIGKKVSYLCVIVRFRNESEYSDIIKRGIKIISLFSLDDFDFIPKIPENSNQSSNKTLKELKTEWIFSSPHPNFEYVIPKSEPLLVKNKLYFGSDNGTFWCLDKKDGSVLWQRKILHGANSKRIFSSPAYLNNTIYFGGYDGNFYALDAETGKVKWVSFDADWVGSSPCVSSNLNLVFVGMEFSFWKKKGGVAAYDSETGRRVWLTSSSEFTHGSPAFSEKYTIVICGSNDGYVYGIQAKKGTILWSYYAGGEVKGACVLSPNEEYVAVATFNNCYVIFETRTGKLVSKIDTMEANFSSPAWIDNARVVCPSLDKNIYCFSVKEGKIIWKYNTSARVFAKPVLIQDKIYIGTNEGALLVIDKNSGDLVSKRYLIERITNGVSVDSVEKTVFIPTQANQIIKVKLENI